MRIRTILIYLSIILSLSSCASYDFSRRIVQQGNLLQAKTISRLHIGMSKDDAATLMGHSLLSPTFNDERWDYAYTWRRGSGPLEVHHLSLYFKHGQLVQITKSI